MHLQCDCDFGRAGGEIEPRLGSNRESFAYVSRALWRRLSSTPSTLPILAPDLFGQVASRKNRIQNYCEQDYPTSCRHDREHQVASPRHCAIHPNTIERGRGRRGTQAATPNHAGTHGRLRGAHLPIRHDSEDDRILRFTRNETRSLSLMFALPVNSGIEKLKDRRVYLFAIRLNV